MNFVVDSSLALTWVLADEATPETDELVDSFGAGAKAYAPHLWVWEIVNVLLSIERSKRAVKPVLASALGRFRSLPIELDSEATERAFDVTRELAQKHRLTSYDAAYLELALRLGLPLATLDRDLRLAAKAESVPVLPRILPEK